MARPILAFAVIVSTIAALATPAEADEGDHLPFGTIDSVEYVAGNLRVDGRVGDPDTPSMLGGVVHFYVDGELLAAASSSLFGLQNVYGAAFPAPPAGTLCVWGINIGPGHNTPIACHSYAADHPGRSIGEVVTIRRGPDHLTMGGWALDPDTPGPIPVHFYADLGDGTTPHFIGATLADRPRPELTRRYGLGDEHGFFVDIPTSDVNIGEAGRVCAWVINVGPGVNRPVDCKSFGKRQPRPPAIPESNVLGHLDSVSVRSDGYIIVAGWAFDPDSASSTYIEIEISDRAPIRLRADRIRRDVEAAYGRGTPSGFLIAIEAPKQVEHRVCVTARDVKGGQWPTSALGCRAVTP